MPKTVLVSMRFRSDVIERIDRVARLEGSKRTTVATELILEGLENRELVAKAMGDPHISQALLQAFAQPAVMRALTSSMRSELSDEQLQLFNEALVRGVQAMPSAPPPTPPPARKKKR